MFLNSALQMLTLAYIVLALAVVLFKDNSTDLVKRLQIYIT